MDADEFHIADLPDIPPWGDLPVGVERMKELLVQSVTEPGSRDVDAEEYARLRSAILADQSVGDLAPDFLRRCRTPREFWDYMKPQTRTWAERRRIINDAFRPMFDVFEGTSPVPSDTAIAQALQRFDSQSVHAIWTRALRRRDSDPAGAITLARTLLETVCKHILDELSIAYSPKDDLPDLYHAVTSALNLAPSHYQEKMFKQILGGVQCVVQGLCSLRNSLGDAHGQGKNPVRPAPRHAELAVNLAGAMATFLVETHQARIASQSELLQRPENIAKLEGGT